MATTGKTDADDNDKSDEMNAGRASPAPSSYEGHQGWPGRQGRQGSNVPVGSDPRPGSLARSRGTLGPFSLIRRLFDDLEQLTGFGGPGAQRESRGFGGLMFVPAVEVMYRDHKLVVNVDLPGMSADDIRVTVHDGALVVEGERHNEHERHESDVWRCERSYGRFQRVIALPEGTDITSTEARFENGVLAISLRAPAQQDGRRIEIKSGGSAKPRSTSH